MIVQTLCEEREERLLPGDDVEKRRKSSYALCLYSILEIDPTKIAFPCLGAMGDQAATLLECVQDHTLYSYVVNLRSPVHDQLGPYHRDLSYRRF